MVRQNSRVRPSTLAHPHARPGAGVGMVAREVSHGRTTVVMTWDFSSGAARVWGLVTSPAKLQLWAPYTADRDLSHVGRAVLYMLGQAGERTIDLPSVVLVADAPRVLEHSWGGDVLEWRLTPVGSGCRLTLHQTLADETMASANAAGWHLCVEVASAVLEGRDAAPVRGAAAKDHGWDDLNAAYAVALGVPATRVV